MKEKKDQEDIIRWEPEMWINKSFELGMQKRKKG